MPTNHKYDALDDAGTITASAATAAVELWFTNQAPKTFNAIDFSLKIYCRLIPGV